VGKARITDVTGVVRNVTRAGNPQSDQSVQLFRVAGGAAKVIDSTNTNQTGQFRFRRVNYDPFSQYRIGMSHLGFPHASETIDFTSDPVTTDVAIHDTTWSDQSISQERVHLIIQFDQGQLYATEIHTLQNWGGIYVGQPTATKTDARQTVKFYLPQNVSGFNVMPMGGNLLTSGNIRQPWGVAATTPFRPGEQLEAFQYEIPYDGSDLDFTFRLAYPTGTAMVIAHQAGPDIEVTGMESREEITRPGPSGQTINLIQYTSNSVGAGAVFEIHVSPQASPGRWFVLVGGVSLLAALGVMTYIRSRRSETEAVSQDDEEPDSAADQDQTAQQLVEEIAALDDLHEDNQLPEDEYNERRDTLKTQLANLLNNDA
jgi:5-hydroxyisourate hydrolase-like protein (transthyretin family)